MIYTRYTIFTHQLVKRNHAFVIFKNVFLIDQFLFLKISWQQKKYICGFETWSVKSLINKIILTILKIKLLSAKLSLFLFWLSKAMYLEQSCVRSLVEDPVWILSLASASLLEGLVGFDHRVFLFFFCPLLSPKISFWSFKS